METLSTVKRLRTTQNISIPTIQCKREFDLPHKFPSKISGKSNIVQKGHNAVNTTNKTITQKNLNNLRGKELLSVNNITKLRIKSQDGKDLGEVKVRFLSQENALSSKTITFNKASLSYKIHKPVKLSIVPPSNTGSLRGSQNDVETSKAVVKSIPSNKVSAGSDRRSEVKEKCNKAQTQYVLTKISKINQQNNDKMVLLKENDKKSLDKVQTLSKNIPKYVTIQKNKILFPSKKKNDDLSMKNQSDSHSEGNTKNQSKTNVLKTQNGLDSEKLAESKILVVKCERLSVPKSKAIGNDITRLSINTNNNESDINSGIRNSTVENNIKLRRNSYSIKPVDNKECHVSTQTNPTNSIDKVLNENSQNEENNNTIQKQEDIVTLVPANNKHISSENQVVPNDTNNKSNSCQNETMRNNTNSMQHEDSISETSKAKEAVSVDVRKEEKLSQHWDIIKEALTSVKDEELRTKALQALADCGIGTPKQIPIKPPENLKTVHDSPIQTDVFGLLDFENFILVKEDTPILERIKQTERSTLKSSTLDAVTQTRSNTKVNRHIDNIDLFPTLSSVSMQDTLDLDNYFIEHFGTNTNVNEVKKVLSTPHSLYKKVGAKLKSDFEGLQKWDENGMVNIHRAVINDQLHELQRLLLVLQASKMSIDIPTDDGETCLELAIKWNASEDIVKLLLKNGANPVSSELLHDSAILLASKCSSPLLPDLVKCVTDSKLLNQVDSLGFAALHYCAFNGNLEGVTALIEAGADVNLKDNRSGRTPFFHALENNYVWIAQKLLVNGAIANLPNFSGQTVLSLIDETKSLSIKAALKHIMG
nr:GATA zinc finger domain-containing protein 7-like [Osmia lignaria]